MSEQVKKYLEEKRNAEKDRKNKEKKEVLIGIGLYEKVYAPQGSETGWNTEYPYSEWHEEVNKSLFYKKIPFEVTDNEYAEILKYSQSANAETSSGMFENIGEKIKAWAKFNCWIGIIASIILAIVFFSIAADNWRVEEVYTTLGIFTLIIGPINSLISSWILYGYGQIIENTDKLVKK